MCSIKRLRLLTIVVPGIDQAIFQYCSAKVVQRRKTGQEISRSMTGLDSWVSCHHCKGVLNCEQGISTRVIESFNWMPKKLQVYSNASWSGGREWTLGDIVMFIKILRADYSHN